MYSVYKKFKRFWKTSDSSIGMLNQRVIINNPNQLQDEKEVFFYSVSTLNAIWQMWNSYWRTYWLTILLGGKDINNIIIPPLAGALPRHAKEEEAAYYLLYLLGRRRNPNGRILGSYQEATWGDKNVIEELSIQLMGPANNIVNALTVYGDSILHLQIVRNAAIHLDKYNINKVKSDILPHYIIRDIKYPTDILYADEFISGKLAIKSWIENLNAFLLII